MMFILITCDADGKISKISAIEFEELYNEHKIKLYNFLIVKVNGNIHQAQDILSDTIYSALLSFPKLKDKNRASSWLFKIANRRFNDHLRKKYKEKSIIENKIIDTEVNSKTFKPSEENENEKIVMLKVGMDNLKQKYKEIIKLKYIENRSQKEIAEIYHISVKSAESIIFRAKEALKKEVEKISKERLI